MKERKLQNKAGYQFSIQIRCGTTE